MKNINRFSKVWPGCAMGALLSAAAFFLLPGIVNAGIGKENVGLLPSGIGFVVVTAAIVLLTAYIRFQRQQKWVESYFSGLIRTLLLLPLFGVVSLLISMISGLLAVLFYNMFKNLLSLGQIKGIIDLAATVLLMLVLPFCIAVFWEQMKSRKSFFAAIAEGIQSGRKNFVKLFILVLSAFVTGWLVVTGLHYAPENWNSAAIKVLLFGAIGMTTLIATEDICTKGRYQK